MDGRPGSVPPQSFLWQGLENSWRLNLLPLGKVEQALEGDTDNIQTPSFTIHY